MLPVKLHMWPSNHPLVEVGLSYRPDLFDSCTETNKQTQLATRKERGENRKDRTERSGQDGEVRTGQDGEVRTGQEMEGRQVRGRPMRLCWIDII